MGVGGHREDRSHVIQRAWLAWGCVCVPIMSQEQRGFSKGWEQEGGEGSLLGLPALGQAWKIHSSLPGLFSLIHQEGYMTNIFQFQFQSSRRKHPMVQMSTSALVPPGPGPLLEGKDNSPRRAACGLGSPSKMCLLPQAVRIWGGATGSHGNTLPGHVT